MWVGALPNKILPVPFKTRPTLSQASHWIRTMELIELMEKNNEE